MQILEAYLFAKRFIAHATDGELHPEEWHRICIDLATHTHNLGQDMSQWQDILDESGRQYHHLLRTVEPIDMVAHYRKSLQTLQRAFVEQPEILETLFQELDALAHADGAVDDMEQHFLAEAARAWNRNASV